MSRDYKSRRSTTSEGSKGSLMLGIFIGYTLGVVSAIGIWFYLERVPSPFLSENQASTYDQPLESTAQPPPLAQAESKIEGTGDVRDEQKTQFDFYKILSNDDTYTTDYEAPQQTGQQRDTEKIQVMEKPQLQQLQPPPQLQSQLPPVQPQVQPPPPPPAQTVQDRPSSVAGGTYFLQVGSFRSNSEADNLKARLALMGVIATIQSADLSEKGVWYRVRVGPFAQKTQVDNVHVTLRENGIEAQLIKVR